MTADDVSDQEHKAALTHPRFLGSKEKAEMVRNQTVTRIQERARMLEEREMARHLAAMRKINQLRDSASEKGRAAAERIETKAYGSAVAAVRGGAKHAGFAG